MARFPDALPEQMAVMLETALRIPRANRTVSDFLFSSLLDSPFHPAHPLPPASLSASLSVHQTQTIDPLPNPLYPPAAGHVPVPSEMLAEQPPQQVMVSDNHAIFIPVASLPPYALGYALFHDPDHQTICLRANPFAPPFAARFVFDSSTQDLLLVTHAGSPPCIGLRATVHNPTSACREHYLITVPPVPYEWPHLPTSPLWMVSNIEFRQPAMPSMPSDTPKHTPSEPAPILSQTSALALLDAALAPDPVPSHHHELEAPTSSLQPWPLAGGAGGASAALADGPHGLFGGAESGGAASFVLGAALQTMQAALSGTFYAPSMRLDLIPGQTSSFTGRSALELRVAPPRLAAEMRDRFAALYYLAVLPVTPDAPLLRPAAQRGVPELPGCAACRRRAANIKRFPVAAAARDQSRADAPHDSGDDFLIGIPDDVDVELPIVEAPDDLDFLTTLDVSAVTARSPVPAERVSVPAPVAEPGMPVAAPIAKTRGRPRAAVRARTLRPRPVCETADSNALSGSGSAPASASASERASTTGARSSAVQDPCGCAEAGTGASETDAKTAREKMLEARKRRNRLSAARSNEKRKARVAALENDVVVGRERVKELSERHRVAAAENARLKQLVTAPL